MSLGGRPTAGIIKLGVTTVTRPDTAIGIKRSIFRDDDGACGGCQRNDRQDQAYGQLINDRHGSRGN